MALILHTVLLQITSEPSLSLSAMVAYQITLAEVTFSGGSFVEGRGMQERSSVLPLGHFSLL